MSRGDAVARKLVTFGRILREAGLEVGPGRLQDALGFRLTCYAVDVSSEHESHTDTTADSGEAVADEVEGAVDGAFHFSSFQDAIFVAGCLGCFIPARGSLWGA